MPTMALRLTEALQEMLELLLLVVLAARLTMAPRATEALQDMLDLLLFVALAAMFAWLRGPPRPCRTCWACRCPWR